MGPLSLLLVSLAAVAQEAAPVDRFAPLRDLGPPELDGAREWTILVYVAGDNDLEKYVLRDLDEMERSLPEKGVEVLALVDRAEGFDESQGDWKGARLYRVQRDTTPVEVTSPVLVELGEVDTGDPRLVEAFVAGGLRRFPARNHALVLWNHGSGWSAMANDFEDGAGGRGELTLPELRTGLAAGLAGAGVERLQLLGFDMCLMAQLEVAAEVEGLADVLVASQALEPGDGWPYDRILPQFGKGIFGGRGLGGAIVREYDAYYDALGDDSTTLSCVDLRAVGDVLRTLDALVTKLTPDVERIWTVASRALFLSESYAGRSDYKQGQQGIHSLDLLDFFKRLRHRTEGFVAEAEFRAFVDAMDRYILASSNNSRRRLSNGVAVYAPVNGDGMIARYAEGRLATTTAWPEFLAAVHAKQAADTSVPKLSDLRLVDHEGNTVESVAPLRNNQLRASIDGRNIVWTVMHDGERDSQGNLITYTKTIISDPDWRIKQQQRIEDAVHTADLEMLEYKDGVTEISSGYEGLRLLYTDGQETSGGTMDVTDLDRGDNFHGPALLEHKALGPKPVDAVLVLDRTWLDVVDIVVLLPTPEGVTVPRRLSMKDVPEDLIVTPLHEVMAPDGKVTYRPSKPLRWGKGLETSLALVSPGDYRATLLVEQLNGRVTRIDADYRVVAHEGLDTLIDNWKRYHEGLLPGTWQVNVLGADGALVPTSVELDVRATSAADLFEVDGRDTTKKGPPDTYAWRLDRTGVPNICFVQIEDGRFTGGVLVPTFLAERDGELVITMHMVAQGGGVWLLTKKGGAAARGTDTVPPGADVPPPTAPTVDANGLVGADDPARFVPVETPKPRPVRQ